MASGRGSAGNVLAAALSFFVPGLGQLTQGRLLAAFAHLVLSGVLWLIGLGWIMHVWSCYSAAVWRGD
jgi:TM2 domain-containing membrane protein YozV